FRLPTWQVNGAPAPNPLYTTHRASGINDGAALPRRQTSFAYAFSFTNFTDLPTPSFGGGRSPATQFSQFTGALENQPHNVVHDLVGGPGAGQCQQGWMSDPSCAAQDPIFWLHHSNIDRLWTNWLAQGGGRANPQDEDWLTTKFTFYDENATKVATTGADIVDTVNQLHYRYDDSLPPVTARLREFNAVNASPASSPQGPPRLIAAFEDGVTLGGQPTSITVPLPASAQNTMESLAAVDNPSRLNLNIEGIQVHNPPGIVYEVHLNLSSDDTPATDDASFVGNITFFGAGHHHGNSGHPHPGSGEESSSDSSGINHSFDITGLVQTLREQNRWNPQQVTVTFVPVGLIPPSGTPGSAYHVEPATSPRISRVSFSSTS
ncbi:MAG: tyrosinase family protein, partial [Terriglobales bacterium]